MWGALRVGAPPLHFSEQRLKKSTLCLYRIATCKQFDLNSKTVLGGIKDEKKIRESKQSSREVIS